MIFSNRMIRRCVKTMIVYTFAILTKVIVHFEAIIPFVNAQVMKGCTTIFFSSEISID